MQQLHRIDWTELTFEHDEDGQNIVLGAGSFGQVLAASYAFQQVAVKTMVRPVPQAFLPALEREAALQASLAHENIVRVHGLASDTRNPARPKYALVLARLYESVEALLTRVAAGDAGEPATALPLPWRLNAILELARGLAYLHSRKVVHADIKPANVMLTSPRTGCILQLTDFGLAAEAGTGGSVAGTLGGRAGGTVPWMAPELLAAPGASGAAARPSFRTDIYAWAVTAWQLLCLLPRPYEALEGQVLSGVLAGTLRPHQAAPPPDGTPEGLQALILRAWAQDPGQRFRSGAELLAALVQVCPGGAGGLQLPPALGGEAAGAAGAAAAGAHPAGRAPELAAWTPRAVIECCAVCEEGGVPGVAMCGAREGGAQPHKLCMPCALRVIRSELTPQAKMVRCAGCLGGTPSVCSPAPAAAVMEVAAWSAWGGRQGGREGELRALAPEELARFARMESARVAEEERRRREAEQAPPVGANGVFDMYKVCPGCGTGVVHARGHHCHHISPGTGCLTCGTHFCYQCGIAHAPGASHNSCPTPGCTLFCSDACSCPDCTDCAPGQPCQECQGECWACNPEQRRPLRLSAATVAASQRALACWGGGGTGGGGAASSGAAPGLALAQELSAAAAAAELAAASAPAPTGRGAPAYRRILNPELLYSSAASEALLQAAQAAGYPGVGALCSEDSAAWPAVLRTLEGRGEVRQQLVEYCWRLVAVSGSHTLLQVRAEENGHMPANLRPPAGCFYMRWGTAGVGPADPPQQRAGGGGGGAGAAAAAAAAAVTYRRVVTPGGFISGGDEGLVAAALAAGHSGVAALNSEDSAAWPLVLRTFEGRESVRQRLKDYTWRYVVEDRDTEITLLQVVAAENAHMPASMRPLAESFYVTWTSSTLAPADPPAAAPAAGSGGGAAALPGAAPSSAAAPVYMRVVDAGTCCTSGTSEDLLAAALGAGHTGVEELCTESSPGWPAILSTMQGRDEVRPHLREYTWRCVAESESQVLLQARAEENAHMNANMRPPGPCFYMTWGRDGVAPAGPPAASSAAGAASSSPGTSSAPSPQAVYMRVVDPGTFCSSASEALVAAALAAGHTGVEGLCSDSSPGWPAILKTMEGRDEVRQRLRDYTWRYVAESGPCTLLQVRAEENAHMPASMRAPGPCFYVRWSSRGLAAGGAVAALAPAQGWACPACTLENAASAAECAACGGAQPAAAEAPGTGEVLSCAYDNSLRLWSADTGECLRVLEGHNDTPRCLCKLSDGRVVCGSDENTLRVWDASTGQCLQVLSGHTDRVYCVCQLQDGRLVSGSRDNTLRVWSAATGECERVLQGHRDWVKGVLGLGGALLVSAADDKTLRIWDADSGACVRVLEGHTCAVQGICLTAEGQLVSGSSDSTVRVWEASTGACLRVLSGHEDRVQCVCVLPNGLLASGSADNSLRVWRVSTGECVRVLRGHTDCVASVCALGGGRMASASGDATLRVWDVATGACLRVLEGHTVGATSVCEL